jgi:hypothetical protein
VAQDDVEQCVKSDVAHAGAALRARVHHGLFAVARATRA